MFIENRLMEKVFFIIACIVFALSSCNQNAESDAINDFDESLGKEKAEALNLALNSFETFLEVNYPDQESQSQRIKLFLEQLETDYEIDSSWVFATSENKEIMEAWENSGLRKEVWLYGYEEEGYIPKYDIHELLPPDDFYTPNESDSIQDIGELEIDLIEDSLLPITELDKYELDIIEREEKMRNWLFSNSEGDFLYALAKYGADDKLVNGYVEIHIQMSISPGIIISALLDIDNDVNFNNPFIERIILVEIYYPLMHQDVDNRK